MGSQDKGVIEAKLFPSLVREFCLTRGLVDCVNSGKVIARQTWICLFIPTRVPFLRFTAVRARAFVTRIE